MFAKLRAELKSITEWNGQSQSSELRQKKRPWSFVKYDSAKSLDS